MRKFAWSASKWRWNDDSRRICSFGDPINRFVSLCGPYDERKQTLELAPKQTDLLHVHLWSNRVLLGHGGAYGRPLIHLLLQLGETLLLYVFLCKIGGVGPRDPRKSKLWYFVALWVRFTSPQFLSLFRHYTHPQKSILSSWTTHEALYHRKYHTQHPLLCILSWSFWR